MYSLKAMNNLSRLYRIMLNKTNELLKKNNLNITSDELLFLFDIFDHRNNIKNCEENNELYIKNIAKNGYYVSSHLSFNINLLQKKSFIKINGDLNCPYVELTASGIEIINNIQKKIQNQNVFSEGINEILLNQEKIKFTLIN